MVAALAAGVACALLVPAGSGQGAAPRSVASGSVLRALARSGSARVVVSLRAPVGGRSLSATAAVAASQRRVLARVGAEFRTARRYRVLPALAGRVTRKGMGRLLAAPEVVAIGLDRRVHASLGQSVPLIRANEVQQAGYTGAGVTVAVVDTGVDLGHPDLAGSVTAEACFIQRMNRLGGCAGGQTRHIGAGAAQDTNGHGTLVSGIITGDGSATTPRGVAPGAGIVAAKVLDTDGSGQASDILAALDWVINDHPEVDVINMSLGGEVLSSNACDDQFDAFADASALTALRRRGVITFAASGNETQDGFIGEPACISSVVSVGAVYDSSVGGLDWGDCVDSPTAADKVVCFSNAAPILDLLAPGAMITSAALGGGSEAWAGTSAATPHAAGVAALLLQARPNLSPDQVEQTLKQTGKPVLDTRNGLTFPRIDAFAALQALGALPVVPGPVFLPDGTMSLADTTGDGGTGPDVGPVTVSSSRGILTFRIRTPNRTAINVPESAWVLFDADRNPATGDDGAELAVFETGQSVSLVRFISGNWVEIRDLSFAARSGDTLTVPISQEELGIVGEVNFQVAAVVNGVVTDAAPDAGHWSYPGLPVRVTLAGTGAGMVTGGAITCGSVCAAFFGRGQAVTLVATAAAGSVFAGWSGACSGLGACNLTVDGPKDVTARFELLRRVTVTRLGAGVGTVASSPGGIACGTTCAAEFANGTRVTLTARAQPGSRFVTWGGACAGRVDCTLDVNGAQVVSARFTDVAAPKARALPGAAKRGQRARLRFRLLDNSGRAAAAVTVSRGAARVAVLRRRSGPARGGVSSVRWRVPGSLAPGRLTFCVRPADGSGNTGRRSCAPLRVT